MPGAGDTQEAPGAPRTVLPEQIPVAATLLVPGVSWREGAVCPVHCPAQNRDSGKGRWDQEDPEHGTRQGQLQEVGAAGSVSSC